MSCHHEKIKVFNGMEGHCFTYPVRECKIMQKNGAEVSYYRSLARRICISRIIKVFISNKYNRGR